MPGTVGRRAAGALALALAAGNAWGWPVPGGDAGRSRIAHGTADLKVPAVRWRRQIGDRPPDGSVLAADVNGDGAVELLAARGGRVDAFGLDGRLGWSTPPLDVDRLGGVFDFDGDGRGEVLAIGPHAVVLIDAQTGRLRWSVPEDAFERVGAVVAGDVDGDHRPDLLVAETACGQSRRGPALVFGFAGGFDGDRQRAVIGDPRGYWCGLWHSLADVDGDGRPEVVVPDRDRFLAFDPTTGERRYDGESIGDLPFGIAPHRVLDVLPEADGGRADELLVLFDYSFGDTVHHELMLVDLNDQHVLAPRWRVPLPADSVLDHERATVVSIGGAPRLLASVYEGGWTVRTYDAATGAELGRVLDARLLGVADLDGDGTPELLTRAGDDRVPAAFGTVVARGLDGTERWRLEHATLLERGARPGDAATTSDRVELRTLPGGRLVALIDADGDASADQVAVIEGTGRQRATQALAGTPGGVPLEGAPDGLPLVLAEADGELAAFDGDLALLDDATGDGVPDVQTPAGLARVVAAPVLGGPHPDPILLTPNGRLTVLDEDGNPVWTDRLRSGGEHPQAGQLVPGGAWEIVAPDGRTPGELAWVALEGPTGRPIWRDALSASDWRSLGAPVLLDVDDDNTVDLVRFDQRRSDEALRVAALDGRDGHLLWENTFARSGDGFVGRLTAVALPPAAARLMVAESTSIHDIDPATGVIDRTVTTGRYGGRVQSTGAAPPLARTGANGPLEVLNRDLQVAWSAPDEGPARGWLLQTATVVGGSELWAIPGGGQPLVRYDLATGTVLDHVGLANGMVQTPPFSNLADLAYVSAVEDLFGSGEPGGLVAAGDGHLYALAVGGTLRWDLPFFAALGDPAIADLDGDGELEILVPAGDATVARVDKPAVNAPAAVWDDDGDHVAGSDAADLDETHQHAVLGADWAAVADTDGYEARVVGPGEMVVADWRDVADTRVRFSALALVPGLTYSVEVRAFRIDGAARSRSAIVASDGVLVVDDVPPEVTLDVSPDPFRPSEGALALHVVASDDDRISALRLVVQDASGRDLALVFQGPVASPHLDQTWMWDGRDFDTRPLPSGEYVAVADVADRGDHAVEARATFRLCGAGDSCGTAPDARVPEPDAGVDAAVPAADAAPAERDGGVEGDGPQKDDGCGCDTTAGSPVALLWLAPLLCLRRRRT